MKQKRPKIKRVILLSRDLVNVGGTDRVMFEEAKYLAKKGIEVHILTYKLDKKIRFIFDLLQQIDIELNIEEIPYRRVSKGLLLYFYKIRALRKRIKEIKPDIIIAQELWVCHYLYLATLFTGFPYIALIHDVPFQSYTGLAQYGLVYRRAFDEIKNSPIGGKKDFLLSKPPKMGLLKRVRFEIAVLIQYLAVRKARKIFTLSNQVKWMAKKMYGKEAIVLKGAFSADKLNYQPTYDIKNRLGLSNEMMLLNINSLNPEKRVDLLLRAFKVVSENLDNVVLIIGGTGPEEKKLKNLAHELDVADKVKFVGYIPEGALWDYYAACDVFAHPFQGDFCIAPFEALALHKKVVVPKEMELDEHLVKNKHVFVADPTVESLAKVITEALTTQILEEDDDLKDDELSEYTWERYVERIYAICEEVTGGYFCRFF